jgi:hypothetical protein
MSRLQQASQRTSTGANQAPAGSTQAWSGNGHGAEGTASGRDAGEDVIEGEFRRV